MRNIKKLLINRIVTGALLGIFAFSTVTWADGQESLLTVRETAQIQQISDGSGKYLMKSDGFYCLNVDGTRENKAGVHCFNNYKIDGTVFDGFYYHDTDGKFKAGNPYLVHLKDVPISVMETDGALVEAALDEGFYMVNNLGKLSAAPQVRYFDNVVVDGVTFNGYYYFDENGKMTVQPGIHYVDLMCNGQVFDGSYYFGGTNGVLVQENMVTSDGFVVADTGRIINLEELGMENLKPQLDKMLSEYEGEWSVYVKDLNTEETILINDKQFYSASLIKAFVMSETYRNVDKVKENLGARLKTEDSAVINVKLEDLLWNMITVSDNESYNELVRLQTEAYDFGKGAESVNEYLSSEGYAKTSVQHTLHPSASI